MALPMPNDPADSHEVTPAPEAEVFDNAQFHRRVILQRASRHLVDAVALDERSLSTTYVMHAPVDTPVQEAVAVLLTRDHQTPMYDQQKEKIYLYFATFDGQIPESEPAVMWLEHISKRGKSVRYEIDEDGIREYRLEDRDVSWQDAIPSRKPSRSKGLRRHRRTQEQLAVQYANILKGFHLTPQRYNPFESAS